MIKTPFAFLFCTSFIFASNHAIASSPYLSKVYDYSPAPGQFINQIPKYENGDTKESIIKKAQDAICHEQAPGMISLGAWGGYVITGFDHPVVNMHGKYDFKVYGNAFYSNPRSSSAEPGIVEVSVDVNGNGIPDDEWYQLAGSKFRDSDTFENFEITYIKPSADKEANPDSDYPAITDKDYIKYTTNDSYLPVGYLQKNNQHTQSYWPEWLEESTLTFKGTRLPDNVSRPEGGIGLYVMQPFEWGYVDNEPNNSCKGFSIDWAVDKYGNPVVLEKVDFIKIYTGVCSTAGWLGEVSTEISGAEDLHPDAVYSPQWPENPETPSIPQSVAGAYIDKFQFLGCREGYLNLRNSTSLTIEIYSAAGIKVFSANLESGESNVDISSFPNGLYVICAEGYAIKFLR
ncbi:MAG: T9SS type A sorting domain-containing protein [Prevotella sp.]|nr:T9SS type A sorting domain-containing protein [Bacteroides sp.]MCM1366462.1 T9SS type A sorting domain-containing protein [Prevotella sp.]MCM1437058.1 T9SS type A sorting domain-containing protein [Prevotella sp.]